MGSVGPPLPNLITMFVDSDGKSVPTGENGELWIKGPTVFKGYHNNPEETSKAITPDGYFKTGDIGFQDMEGNMFITDRIKELIKYKGSQVAPAELEGILASHPKVKDVAVIGVQVKAIESEVPMAFVVPAQGVVMDETSAEELVNWTASRVVKHKKLRGGIVWIDEIPKSTTGKILRQILKTNIKVAKPMAATKFIPTSKLEKL